MRGRAAWFVMLALWLGLSALAWARPGEDERPPAGAAGEKAPGEEDAAEKREPRYLGAKVCRICHKGMHASWSAREHAAAWEHLPEAYRNLEARDAQGRPCVTCHVTGWGQGDREGFVDLADPKSKRLLGVQCEACHGAGSEHRRVGMKLLKYRRKNEPIPEGTDTRIQRVPTNCATCHNTHVSHRELYLPKPKAEPAPKEAPKDAPREDSGDDPPDEG